MKHRILWIFVGVLMMSAPAFAIGEARIEFTVVDSQGNSIPDVKVTVKATEQITYENHLTTDEHGKVSIFVVQGTVPYEFTFEKEGFATFRDTLRMKLVPERNVEKVTLGPATESVVEVPVGAGDAAAIYNDGALANQGDTAGSIAKFEEAVAMDPTLSAGFAALARVHARAEQWNKAIDAGMKALELAGDDDAIFAILANAYEKTGDRARAAEYRSKLPESAAEVFNQAVPHLNAGRDEEAEPLLLKALAIDENFAKAHYELGNLYARKSKNALAREHFEKYLQLEPAGDNAAFVREMLKYLE